MSAAAILMALQILEGFMNTDAARAQIQKQESEGQSPAQILASARKLAADSIQAAKDA